MSSFSFELDITDILENFNSFIGIKLVLFNGREKLLKNRVNPFIQQKGINRRFLSGKALYSDIFLPNLCCINSQLEIIFFRKTWI